MNLQNGTERICNPEPLIFTINESRGHCTVQFSDETAWKPGDVIADLYEIVLNDNIENHGG